MKMRRWLSVTVPLSIFGRNSQVRNCCLSAENTGKGLFAKQLGKQYVPRYSMMNSYIGKNGSQRAYPQRLMQGDGKMVFFRLGAGYANMAASLSRCLIP